MSVSGAYRANRRAIANNSAAFGGNGGGRDGGDDDNHSRTHSTAKYTAPAFTPPTPEEIAAHGDSAKLNFQAARDLRDGAKLSTSEYDTIHNHLRDAKHQAAQYLLNPDHTFTGDYTRLGRDPDDQNIFDTMGTTSKEYHGLLRDADLASARELASHDSYADLAAAKDMYYSAALHEGFAGQPMPLSYNNALSDYKTNMDKLIDADGNNFEERLRNAGVSEIRRVLALSEESGTAAVREDAAHAVNNILAVTGLKADSPELAGEAEDIHELTDPDFGTSVREFINNFKPK